ncbi:MAG: hypothetical protein HY355_00315 [Armatimonadetes bacterium]|nr:hypothetical protein [Armatimonadota bacterium]
MDLRLLLSHLASARTRAALARWLLVVCVLGFAGTVAVLAVLGHGLDRWLFVLIVWAVLVFIPLRIALDAGQTLGARMRVSVSDRIAGDPGRYARPALMPIVVADLFARAVTMPRITTPEHAHKAREAAVAILRRIAGRPDATDLLRGAVRTSLAAAASEAVQVSAAATGTAADNIQARWDGARALGALAAVVQLLAAAFADRWGVPPVLPELEGRSLSDFLEAAMDYCDEAALQVDALPWTEPPLAAVQDSGAVDEARMAWRTFMQAGEPAPQALQAFLAAVIPEGFS